MKRPKLTNGQRCLRQLRGALRSLRYATQLETTNNSERMRWQTAEHDLFALALYVANRVRAERAGRS